MPTGRILNMMFTVEPGSTHALLAALEAKLDSRVLGVFLQSTMVPHLQRKFKEGFASETDPSGAGWAPLSAATVKIREDQGYGGAHPINRRTGELENYITQSPGQLIPSMDQAVLKYPSERGVPSGSLGKKVRGAQKGEGKAPPRPVLGLDEQDLAFMLASLFGYFEGPGTGWATGGIK